jgi:hypothetical protein
MRGDERAAALRKTMDHLVDLITALDRRLPQVQRMGEATIVTAAARLRDEARARIREIEHDIAGRESHDSQPVDTL